MYSVIHCNFRKVRHFRVFELETYTLETYTLKVFRTIEILTVEYDGLVSSIAGTGIHTQVWMGNRYERGYNVAIKFYL